MQITPKLFAGLTLAAGVSLAAAGLIHAANNEWASGEVTGEALFPELSQTVNDVAAVELTQGGETLTLARQDEGWAARQAGGYPVKTDRVRTLLVRLSQAELIEPKTRKPERYPLLDLGDPEAEDSAARRLRLLDEDKSVLAEAVIGKKRWDAFGSGRSGMYVRRPEEKRTWLSSLDVSNLKPGIKNWVDLEIFSTDAAKISSLTLNNPGEEPLEFARSTGGDSKFVLTGVPEDAELKGAASADSTVEAFANIELEDVRKPENPVADPDASARLETADGLAVRFRLRKEGEEAFWLSLSAEGGGDAAEQAEELNARVEGWEFRIPSWKADSLFKKRADFFGTS